MIVKLEEEFYAVSSDWKSQFRNEQHFVLTTHIDEVIIFLVPEP